MKKRIGMLILVTVLIVGAFLFFKASSPLEINTIASAEGKLSVVVSVGNTGFKDIRLADVLVNDEEPPGLVKVQVSNAPLGLIMTGDPANPEAVEYNFTDLDEVIVKTGTSASETFAKQDNGTATEADEIYGINAFHHEPIERVHIKYRYFGILFGQVVSIQP